MAPRSFFLTAALIASAVPQAGPSARATAPAVEEAAAVLSRHRIATQRSAAPPTGTLVRRYRYVGQGLTGTVEMTADLASGRFVNAYDIDPIASADGFDGTTPWMRDLSRTVTLQQGGDRLALAVNEAYRNANLWWRSDRGGARIDALGQDADGAHLRVTPRGGKAFDAWFDPVTGHLAKISEVRGSRTSQVRYSAFETRGGRIVPTVVRIGDRDDAQTMTLLEARWSPPRPAARYRLPPSAPRDWTLPPSGKVTVPFRLFNNHVFVDVMVNGRGPFPFMVDSGGHNIITPSTLAAAGLVKEGETTSGGAGANVVSTGYVRVAELALGGMTSRDQAMATLEFSPKAVEGFQVGGMIGFEIHRRFVVRMDYGASTLTLIDPARFDARDAAAAGTRVPFLFYDHIPQVTGRFADLPARFNIDTGARNEVSLTKPFVERHRLRERFARGIEAVDGWGVGGPGRSYIVRAPSLSLGRVRIDNPVAGLALQNRGAFSDANYEGNIGSGLLKRFVVTFDYPKQVMYLKPATTPSDDIGTFDRVGAWINLGDGGFQIVDVAKSSPADRAGLRQGDLLTAIDGRPVTGLALSDARRLFRTASTERDLVLAILRDGLPNEIRVRPRDQI